jgi:RecA/RadA recombinase
MVKRGDEELVTPYNFAPRFERAVVYLACGDLRFYGLAGHQIDPKALSTPVHKLAVEAAQAIARDIGHGPGSSLLVVQRLSRWRADGKVAHEDVLAVDDLMEEGDAAHATLNVEGILNELIPVLRQRMQDAATRNLIDATAKNDDEGIAQVEEQLSRARSLGKVENSLGTKVSSHSFEEITRARYMDRLPFGVAELDVLLDGGTPRGTLTVVLGDQKSGKSMFSSHVTASAQLRRQFCAYASLEVPRHAILARLKANLTGVPINTLLNGDTAQAKQVMAEIEDRLGPCYVKNFPAKATTVQHLRQWVADLETAEGRKLDLLVVDYLDKLKPPKTMDKEGSSYAGTGNVFEEVRVWAEQSGFWCFSPTQSQGRGRDRGKHKGGQENTGSTRDVLDMGDEADSVEKSRVADLFLTLNPRDEGRSILFYVAGYRHGVSRRATPPIPVDFTCGRIAPVDLTAGGGDDW